MLFKRHLTLPTLLIFIQTIHSRQSLFDPYIECEGPAFLHAHGLPAAYDEASYSTTLALCSAAHGAPRNVGCSCTSSGGQVHCDESMADSTLYNTIFGQTAITIAEYCRRFSCFCRITSEIQTVATPSFSSFAAPTRAGQRPSRVTNSQYDPAGPNPFRDTAEFGQDFSQGSSQCGIGCGNNEECQSCAADPVAANQYTCRAAQKSQSDPATGATKFLSMCLIAASTSAWTAKSQGPGGKRDVELPCPCNSTYVSHGCCGAKNGLVWEPTGSNLGMLVGVDDL